MTIYPYCSHQLIRQIQANQIFWFCRHCWQEVPDWKCKKNDLSLKGSGYELIIAKETAVLFKL